MPSPKTSLPEGSCSASAAGSTGAPRVTAIVYAKTNARAIHTTRSRTRAATEQVHLTRGEQRDVQHRAEDPIHLEERPAPADCRPARDRQGRDPVHHERPAPHPQVDASAPSEPLAERGRERERHQGGGEREDPHGRQGYAPFPFSPGESDEPREAPRDSPEAPLRVRMDSGLRQREQTRRCPGPRRRRWRTCRHRTARRAWRAASRGSRSPSTLSARSSRHCLTSNPSTKRILPELPGIGRVPRYGCRSTSHTQPHPPSVAEGDPVVVAMEREVAGAEHFVRGLVRHGRDPHRARTRARTSTTSRGSCSRRCRSVRPTTRRTRRRCLHDRVPDRVLDAVVVIRPVVLPHERERAVQGVDIREELVSLRRRVDRQRVHSRSARRPTSDDVDEQLSDQTAAGRQIRSSGSARCWPDEGVVGQEHARRRSSSGRPSSVARAAPGGTRTRSCTRRPHRRNPASGPPARTE